MVQHGEASAHRRAEGQAGVARLPGLLLHQLHALPSRPALLEEKHPDSLDVIGVHPLKIPNGHVDAHVQKAGKAY